MLPLLAFLALAEPAPARAATSPSAPASTQQETHPGDALRARLGRSLPASGQLVIIYGVSAHHERTEMSAVAWRDRPGTWEVEEAGETLSLVPAPPGTPPGQANAPRPVPVKTFPLTPEVAARLDQMLADPELYRTPERAGGYPPIGGWGFRMEIVTPSRHLVTSWGGRLEGRAGEVADAVIGRG